MPISGSRSKSENELHFPLSRDRADGRAVCGESASDGEGISFVLLAVDATCPACNRWLSRHSWVTASTQMPKLVRVR